MDILFITSTRIGDAVLSTGLLDHLSRLPGARITVACGKLPAPLFRHAPAVIRVIEIVKKKRAGHWLDLWKATVGTRWDLVVDLRSSAFAWTVRAKRRVVFRASAAPVHKVLQLAGCLGLDPAPSPKLWPSEAAKDRAAALLGDGPVIAVAPTANWAPKQWPGERFAAVVRELLTGPLAGSRVAVFGAPGERDAAQPFFDAAVDLPVLDLVGKVGLDETAACLSRCRFFIGNDSGLMHMAAVSGIPTLGLFGPSNPAWYAPWGARTAWVAAPGNYQDLIARARREGERDSVMDELPAEVVTRAAFGLLG